MKFKTIDLQLTGNISVDTRAFQDICAERHIHLETTSFLESEVHSRLGANFALYLCRETAKKRETHHYIFITSTTWGKDTEDKFLNLLGNIMQGEGHDGVRDLLYVYSSSDLSEKVAKYIEWAQT